MAANTGRSLGAPPGAAAWNEAQTWRTNRRAMAQRFLAEGAATSAGFAVAWSDDVGSRVDHIIQVAVARINAAAKAKALAAASSSAIGTSKPKPTTVYAGASTIDLVNNRLTLGDGTVVDIRTGTKVD